MTYHGISGLIEFGVNEAYKNGYSKGFWLGVAAAMICVLAIIGISLVIDSIVKDVKKNKIKKESIENSPLQKEAS